MYSRIAFIGADAVDLQGGIMSHNQTMCRSSRA
jgi:DeoR/GlpR family transcriptional regulator of sugar metabolism